MGNFFGDALVGLGKIAIERIAGIDAISEEISHTTPTEQDIVIDQLNKLIELVEKSVSEVNDLFNELSSRGVSIYGDFEYQNVVIDLEKMNKSFYQHVEYVLDKNHRGQNSQFLLLYLEETVIPLVQSISQLSLKFIHNLHAPALLSGTWPEILKIVDFAAEVDIERNEGVDQILDQISEISTVLDSLKDELVTSWSPYGEEDFSDWRGRFEAQFQLLLIQHKALVASLSQPVATANTGSGLAVLEQIKKLGELRDLGLITADEFEVKKQKLLDQI
jgi:hypothetical protein